MAQQLESTSYQGNKTQIPLSSLAEWGMSHIKSVFESKSDEECSSAIAATFVPDLDVTMNGNRITLAELKQMVAALRASGDSALYVLWLPGSIVELPSDKHARDGTVAGVYTISGIKRDIPLSDNGETIEMRFERRKVVRAKIRSTSEDLDHDSRRIVALDVVATDNQIPQRDTAML